MFLIKFVQGELAWAHVRDAEADIVKEEEKVEFFNQKIAVAEDTVRQMAETEKTKLKEKKKLEGEIQDLAKDFAGEEAAVKRLQEDSSRKKEKAREAKKELLLLEGRQSNLGREKTALATEIEKLRRTGTEEFEERHRQRQVAIKSNQDRAGLAQSTLDTTLNHLNHINNNIREVDSGIHELRAEKEREAGIGRKIRANLENLQRSGNNRLAAFGDWMPGVVQDINNSRRFKTKPIGPLGLYIKVKEGTPENIVKTLDNELRSLVYAFLVSSSDDQKELFRIFQNRRVQQKPSIFTSNFSRTRHNIESGRVYTDQFEVLIDYLEVEDVNVYNRIVDSAQLERILHTPNETVARKLLSVESTVPRNTAYACVANSFYYYPAPVYRSYPYDEKPTGLLKRNVEEIMESERRKIQVQVNKEKDLERAISEAQAEKMTHSKESAVNERKVRDLHTQIRSINAEIVSLKNEEEAERPPDISALEEDLERARRNLAVNTTELAEVRQRYEGLQNDFKTAQQAAEEVRQELVNKMERVEPLRENLADLEASLNSDRRAKIHYDGKTKEYVREKKDAEKIVEEKREKLLAAEEKAMGWAPERLSTRKKVDSLKKEIVHLEESLRQQEENQESRQLVTQKYQEFRATYTKVDAQIKYMSSTVEFLGEMLKQRKEGYKEIRGSTCKNINRNFTTMLHARNYLGQLLFDHKDSLLTIQVNPNCNSQAAGLDVTRGVRSLSGGEKSYSGVSLTLALWNAMTPPFR